MVDLIDPKHTRRDLRKLEASIRKGWEIPDAIFEKTSGVLGSILAKGKPREQIAAARVLVAMNEQNGKPDGPVPQMHLHKHEHEATGEPVEDQDIEQRRARLRERFHRIRRNRGIRD